MSIDEVSRSIGALQAGQDALQEQMRAENERTRARDARLFAALEDLSKAVAPLPAIYQDVEEIKPKVASLQAFRLRVATLAGGAAMLASVVGPDIWDGLLRLLRVR